ncbi:hypothetical protein Tco_0685579 [Tanacetum coccineum]
MELKKSSQTRLIFSFGVPVSALPTRDNLVRRECHVDLHIQLCPSLIPLMRKVFYHTLYCWATLPVLFFPVEFAVVNLALLDWISFQEWHEWFLSIRMSSTNKLLLEEVFSVAWWILWRFRNRLIFEDIPPKRSEIFDDIVLLSFNWCSNRCPRFQRKPLNEMNASTKNMGENNRGADKCSRSYGGAMGSGKSYVNVLKSSNVVESPSPALVIDDAFVVRRELDNYVMGEVKLMSSIVNILTLLSAEEKFMKHVGVASWFNRLCDAEQDFVSRERIAWVDIEGVPLHGFLCVHLPKR